MICTRAHSLSAFAKLGLQWKHSLATSLIPPPNVCKV